MDVAKNLAEFREELKRLKATIRRLERLQRSITGARAALPARKARVRR